MESGRVRLTIDLQAAGKARGHIVVPLSTDKSAYGSTMIPVTVVRNGTGPTVLLQAACTVTSTKARSSWHASHARWRRRTWRVASSSSQRSTWRRWTPAAGTRRWTG